MGTESARVPYAPTPGHYATGGQQLANPTQATRHAPSRVTVLTPKSGEIVTVGDPVLIHWQTSCIPGLLLHYVQLSTDGGATFLWNISPLLDGKNSHYLWIPTENVVTRAARIRVVAINWGEATNDGPFIIQPTDRRGCAHAAPILGCGACWRTGSEGEGGLCPIPPYPR
jgi:hypothetical protein